MIDYINKLKEDLSFFEEEIEKYEYIIELGKNAKQLDDKYKINENLIPGCASKLWITYEKINGLLIFHTDGNTVIVRGLAKIIEDVFSNQMPEAIIDFETDVFKELGLTQFITHSRQNGIENMIKKIKKIAQEEI